MLGFDRLRREWLALTGIVRALRATVPIGRNPTRVFPLVMSEAARRHGPRPAILGETGSLTFAALEARANRYARWALAQGLAKGETIALLMPNRPDYFAIWLGVLRAGGTVALLNTNVGGAGLAHAIGIVDARHVIVDSTLAALFAGARERLTGAPRVWVYGEAAEGGDPRLDLAVAELDGGPLAAGETPALTIEDRALYIYTSGTTGLPKAANINHYRLMAITHGFSALMNARASDRMYDALPMYHTVGGVIATGAPLIAGGSVVIREKFSAREFWDDIVRFDCTLFQYVGELCRYLLNAPPGAAEKHHRIRLCCGNGLRPDIWRAFKDRFRIPRVFEFYAATESNIALFNLDGREGAVGRVPGWAKSRFPIRIVKLDDDHEPLRGPDGLCLECPPGEPGEVLGEVLNDPKKPASRFEGYADEEATRRRILRDVARKGDVWFRSGDLMTRDRQGYFYFVDRIGDTFRWKGENVATTQVAEMLSAVPGVKEVNVYGVKVPGTEGRAGMAALVVGGDFSLEALHRHAAEALPDFARPLFVRIMPAMDMTGTFKPRKQDLARQGFDPLATTDPLWFAAPGSDRYEPIDAALHRRICLGAVRL